MYMYYKENMFTCSYHLKTITANELLTSTVFLIVDSLVECHWLPRPRDNFL